MLFGIGCSGIDADFIVTLHFLQAYFLRTCCFARVMPGRLYYQLSDNKGKRFEYFLF